jgi:hypothetical protein
MWQQTAALRDFDPAYDRLGSFASEAIRAGEQRMSAFLRKRTNGRRLGNVRFVPILLQKSAIKDQSKRRIFLELSGFHPLH